MTARENADIVDLLKFIGSIMIFLMHNGTLLIFGHTAGVLSDLLCRWAVPFFFISSAYFLYANHKADGFSQTKKYIKRILILYLVWFIYNIPSIVYKVISLRPYTVVKVLLFVKTSLISSAFTGSWFLISCIFSALIIAVLKKKLTAKAILLISFFVQIICVFSSVYGGMITGSFKSVLTFLEFPMNIFGGLFYFSLGLHFAENKDKINKIKNNILYIILIAGLVMYFGEIYIAKYFNVFHTSDQAFSLILLSSAIFILALKGLKTIPKAKLLRKISTIIYCAQGNILFVSIALQTYLKVGSPVIVQMISLTLMVCIIALVLFLQKRKIKFAKYLT